MKVFTVGYEGLDIERFLALLAQHGIDTVVDVRELPLSRKRGFSKRALAGALNLAGLRYLHMAKLGCPRPIRNRYRQDRDWQRYTHGFIEHLHTQAVALDELSGLARSANCALLCYEADYNQCHRALVANALHERYGTDIHHLQAS
jgi:uncharacterized protein (DUF488 family)